MLFPVNFCLTLSKVKISRYVFHLFFFRLASLLSGVYVKIGYFSASVFGGPGFRSISCCSLFSCLFVLLIDSDTTVYMMLEETMKQVGHTSLVL